MKLLVVSPSYWPAFQFGGTVQSLHFLVKNLVSNGIEVEVFATNTGLKDKVNKKFVDGVKIHYFSYFKYLIL